MKRSVRVLLVVTSFVAAPALAQLEVWTSGNTIWARAGADLQGVYCCRGAALDDPSGVPSHCSPSCGYPNATQFTCNWVGQHTVYGCWVTVVNGVPGEKICEQRTVTVTEAPSFACASLQFTGIGSNRILTRKFGESDAYPTGQSVDATKSLLLKSWTVVPGTDVYIRVVDPPDTSPYGAPHPPDDNLDSAAGTINLAPATSGEKVIQTTIPPEGKIRLALFTTDYASGDNYEVQVSANPALLTDPEFICESPCVKTPVLTAWKRVYVEKDSMVQRGAYLTAPVPAGSSILPVASTSPFGNGAVVRLMHAPGIASTSTDFYSEVATVKKVVSHKSQLELSSPTTKAYSGPEFHLGEVRPYLADAVALVSGGEWILPLDQLQPAWNLAFVETATVSDDPVPYIPYEPIVSGFLNQEDESKHLGIKWYYHRSTSNHMHLSSAWDAGGTTPIIGLGRSTENEAIAWVFVGTAQGWAPDASENKFIAEATVHELTHLWQPTGPGWSGHCNIGLSAKSEFDSQNRCTMSDGNVMRSCGIDVTCPEFFDGTSRFHYVDDGDSEYAHIRRRPEPMPVVLQPNQ